MFGARGNVDYSRVSFVDERERVLFAEVQIGQEARDFLATQLGQYLRGCAEREIADCTAAIAEVNPDSWFGRRKIKRLQQDMAGAKRFIQWLAEAIQAGNLAEKELLGETEGE